MSLSMCMSENGQRPAFERMMGTGDRYPLRKVLQVVTSFDRVNHDKLMGRVAARVSDKRLRQLIRALLNSG
jgi:hypothetical protein